jgi:hypothetical protein
MSRAWLETGIAGPVELSVALIGVLLAITTVAAMRSKDWNCADRHWGFSADVRSHIQGQDRRTLVVPDPQECAGVGTDHRSVVGRGWIRAPRQSARSLPMIARIGMTRLALTQRFLAAVALAREVHELLSNSSTGPPA